MSCCDDTSSDCCSSDNDFAPDIVKIDQPTPFFHLPAYDPVKDDTTEVALIKLHEKDISVE